MILALFNSMKQPYPKSKIIIQVLIGMLLLIYRNANAPLLFLTAFVLLIAFVSSIIWEMLNNNIFQLAPGKSFKTQVYIYLFDVVVLAIYIGILMFLISTFLDKKIQIIKQLYF